MKSHRRPLLISIVLMLVVLLAAGVWRNRDRFWSAADASNKPEQTEANPSETTLVELTPEKLQNAGIEVSEVRRQALREWRTIPGRLQYNQTRHIELRAPTDGTLQAVLVKPGDSVALGTPVAMFSSPEVGKARAEVLQLEAQWQIVKRRREWEQKIVANTEDLIEQLTSEPDMADLQLDFKNRTLGQARETLTAAYTRFRLAEQMLQGSEALRSSGAMSAKTLQERTANLQSAQAAFHAATEQVLFDARNRLLEVDAEFKNATRQLDIGRQKLTTLLGYPDKSPAEDSPSLAETSPPISRVELCSPMAGTIEQIHFAPNERLTENAPILVIADTRTLWVAAEIRDSDWAALQIAAGDEVKMHSPAMPQETINARVVFVGREVSEQTHALPLMAEIDNSAGAFRPGMFVRVQVPVGQPKETLAVRPDTLMQHEGRQFVFVKQAVGRYRRVDVATGLSTPEWVEITQGLNGGERIVEHGAFVLKSELLLEGEDE